MQWEGDGFVLSVRPHGETSAILNVLTREQGRHAGLVRGGRSRRLRPVLQTGNKVHVSWNARLSEHLGMFSVELIEARAGLYMQNRLSLAGLNAVSSLCMQALAERQPYERLYDVVAHVLDHLNDAEIWPALYVRFEMCLLDVLGYGLDLESCAATGSTENLTYVSPRSGRAVSAEAAEPWKHKLLPLPGFLSAKGAPGQEDILQGLELTGYFLRSRVFHAQNKDMPEARQTLLAQLSRYLTPS